MNGIYQDYYDFIRVAFLLQMRPWNCHRKSDSAYTHASLGGGHHAIPPNACFNEHWYMKGIWMVYERHISSGGLLLVSGTLPGLPGLPSAPGRFGPGTSANLSVLTTESPPTRGWGLPKFHSQVLISYTWLPLRDPWLAPSAHPNSKACFCRGAYLPVYGMVDVALPWRKQGKRGTRPRRSSVLPM